MDIAFHISDWWCGCITGVFGLLAFELLLAWLLSRKKSKEGKSNGS